MLRRYLLYLLRWQCSTPILAPVMAYFKHSPSLFGTVDDWIGSMVANLIGGLIFFWIDRLIFTAKGLDAPLWMVKEEAHCVDCGQVARGYRLVLAASYDRTRDEAPQYRCECCSVHKAQHLRQQGVEL